MNWLYEFQILDGCTEEDITYLDEILGKNVRDGKSLLDAVQQCIINSLAYQFFYVQNFLGIWFMNYMW